MIKCNLVYALSLMFVFNTFCTGQNKTNSSKENIKAKTKDTTTSHGPKRIVRNIIQDRKGIIWIASWDGIFRYDGKSFTNITSSVSSARFFSVLEDRNGNLWFGSIGSGVYYYDGKSFRNFTTKDGLLNNEIVCIYEDKAGNIWFGTNGGVSHFDGKSFRNYMMKGDSMIEVSSGETYPDFTRGNEVNSIIEDKTGKFWFGTRGNTYVYDGNGFTVFTYRDKPFKNVRSIIEDKKGSIWLCGQDGFWRYNSAVLTNFTTKRFVGYVYEDKEGNIWTSSESAYYQGWALSRYDVKTLSDNKPTVTEIKSGVGMIFGILEAHDGRIWLGTGKGIHIYDGNTITNAEGKVVQEFFSLY